MEEKKVLERLQRQCVRMETCTSDLYRKALKAMEGDAEAAARILASLTADRFVDDRRYAGMVVRHYAARGYGRRRIEQELYRRGIGRPLWDQAMEELPAADDTVYALLCQKLRGTQALPPDIQRAQGYLLRRGYSWEEIRAALDHYRAQNEDDTRDE